MGSDIGLVAEVRLRHDGWFAADVVDGGFCGSHIFAVLSQVPFCSGDRLGEVFANECGSEVGPRGKETGIDCLRPSFADGAEACTLEVLHTIRECFHRVYAVD